MVEFELSVSDHPWGRVLVADFDFEEEARFLLFAWNGQQLVWAKASTCDTSAELNLCYHPCLGDKVQLLAGISGTVSTDLILKSNQVPTSGMRSRAEISVPSVLYTTRDHGLGLLAVRRGLTQSRRKGLWHIRPEAITPELALFAPAYGRRGTFVGHPFLVERSSTVCWD
jgi:hypothetical protein